VILPEPRGGAAASEPSEPPEPPEPLAATPALRDAILAWFDDEGRPLAFRETADPWAILVSEAMAQQTQASRAAEAWGRFLAEFPTVHALAGATPAAVLRAWRGLGYNRRALALRQAAIAIVSEHGGPASHGAIFARTSGENGSSPGTRCDRSP